MPHIKRILTTGGVILLAAVPVIAWTQRQDIYDYVRLRGYQPSARIIALADHTTMQESARRLFYVNHPSLDDKATFNGRCRTDEITIILGCYIAGQGIYLYDVEDSRLDGIEEVTAAHEMLHAAYDRLSDKERRRIDTLTAQASMAITDERITQTIEQYRSKDATIVPNELHSILGTEVVSLPDELEQYYSRYFKDRQAVVRFAVQYEQEFTRRRNQVSQFDAQLEELKQQIERNQAELEDRQNSLSAERNRLDQLLTSDQYAAYNSGVATYNNSVGVYNTLVAETQSLIDTYNGLVAERNSLATEEQTLFEAIDTRPSTISTE